MFKSPTIWPKRWSVAANLYETKVRWHHSELLDFFQWASCISCGVKASLGMGQAAKIGMCICSCCLHGISSRKGPAR